MNCWLLKQLGGLERDMEIKPRKLKTDISDYKTTMVVFLQMFNHKNERTSSPLVRALLKLWFFGGGGVKRTPGLNEKYKCEIRLKSRSPVCSPLCTQPECWHGNTGPGPWCERSSAAFLRGRPRSCRHDGRSNRNVPGPAGRAARRVMRWGVLKNKMRYWDINIWQNREKLHIKMTLNGIVI